MSFLVGKPNRRFPTSLSEFFLGGKIFFMKIWEAIKTCFKRDSSKKEERSPYYSEEVSKVPKDKMMERIAHVVKSAEEEQEKKGRR